MRHEATFTDNISVRACAHFLHLATWLTYLATLAHCSPPFSSVVKNLILNVLFMFNVLFYVLPYMFQLFTHAGAFYGPDHSFNFYAFTNIFNCFSPNSMYVHKVQKDANVD